MALGRSGLCRKSQKESGHGAMVLGEAQLKEYGLGARTGAGPHNSCVQLGGGGKDKHPSHGPVSMSLGSDFATTPPTDGITTIALKILFCLFF